MAYGRDLEPKRRGFFDTIEEQTQQTQAAFEQVWQFLLTGEAPIIEVRLALKSVTRELARRTEAVETAEGTMGEIFGELLSKGNQGRVEVSQPRSLGKIFTEFARSLGGGDTLRIGAYTLQVGYLGLEQLHQLRDILEECCIVELEAETVETKAIEQPSVSEVERLIERTLRETQDLIRIKQAMNECLDQIDPERDRELYEQVKRKWQIHIMRLMEK